MARTARTTSTARTVAAEAKDPKAPTTAKVAPKAAPAEAAPKMNGVDIRNLAGQVTEAPALPKMTRTSSAIVSPFVALVQRSWDEKIALQVPPVAADDVVVVLRAIRRAATQLDLGVAIRKEETADGVIVRFQAKVRAVRPNLDDAKEV